MYIVWTQVTTSCPVQKIFPEPFLAGLKFEKFVYKFEIVADMFESTRRHEYPRGLQQAIITLLRGNLNNIIFLKSQGKDTIAFCLRNTPMTKLEKVFELMKTPVKGKTTVQKTECFRQWRGRIWSLLSANCADRVHNEYGAELRFDLKSFAKLVENELESHGRLSISAETEKAEWLAFFSYPQNRSFTSICYMSYILREDWSFGEYYMCIYIHTLYTLYIYIFAF